MARIWLIILAALFILASCHERGIPETYDLEGVVTFFDEADKKYDGSWHEELLATTMVPLENIDPYITELIKFNATIAQQGNSSNETILLDLVASRIAMLTSEKYYHLALEADPRGLTTIVLDGTEMVVDASLEDFDCANADNISKASEHLNITLAEGHKFLNAMDNVLQNSVEARSVVGIDENRSLFYLSPLGKVFTTIRVNALLLQQRCR